MKFPALAFAFCSLATARVFAQETPTTTPEAVPEIATPVAEPNTQRDVERDAQRDAAPSAAAPAASPAPVVRELEAAERRRAAGEARLRSLISGYGYEAEATQDAIIEFLSAEETARRPLRDAARRLVTALRRGAPPERLRQLVADYKTAVEADRTRRVGAQSALDARIGYSVDPRLEAFLWVSGILGESTPSLLNQLFSRRGGDRRGGREERGGEQKGEQRENNEPTPRRGVAIGTLLARGDVRNGEVWVEVGSERGERERYSAFWRPGRGFDLQVLNSMAEIPLGQRVRLEWQGENRKHITAIAAEEAPTNTLAPTTTNPTVATPETTDIEVTEPVATEPAVEEPAEENEVE